MRAPPTIGISVEPNITNATTFGFAKHTLAKRLAAYDPALTEWENMKTNGWDRIWDCGSFRYEMAF